jgi:hypothetical protein
MSQETVNPKPKGIERLERLEQRVDELERELHETRTFLDQFVNNIKLAAVEQTMQNPEFQAQIQRNLLEQIKF